ncbi:hypothetical protein Acr_00g0030110 [Actinidia rufa]|uniref:Retrotransposon gag domain-containing protein n=1 Tax=Actinidia rufa TaxID=165716 RepID=A0A7J0DER3_9ERIC|nr:hypothetical protein Acr_00g0030110 [Actinidia rufa]
MSWIYASINEFMLGQIVGYTSASQIWEALERLYAAASFAHLTELRTALQTIKKDGLTALAYIQKFRHLCNSLASIGEPVTYTDHLIYFLGGLGRDYNPFVTSIQSQAIRPSIEEVHSLLLSYDARLERQSATDTLSSLQANLANLTYQKPKFKNPSTNSFPNSNSYSHPRGQNRNPSYSPNPSSPKPRPRCQICLKPGHTANKCYHRTNLNYQPPPPPPRNFNAYITPNPSISTSRPTSQPVLLLSQIHPGTWTPVPRIISPHI